MRGLLLCGLTALLALAIGCSEQASTETEPEPLAEAPRTGYPLYPLSTPQPVPPMQNYSAPPTNYVATYTPPPGEVYTTPGDGMAYTTQPTVQTYGQPYSQPVGQPYTQTFTQTYAQSPTAVQYPGYSTGVRSVTDTQFASSLVPMADPPVIVDNVYQPQTAVAYAPQPSAPTRAPGYTSPYSSVTTATYTAPTTVNYTTTGPATTTTHTYTAPAATTYAGPTTTTTTYTASTSYSPPVTYTQTASTGYAPAPVIATASYAPPQPAYTTALTTAPAVNSIQLVPAPDIPPGDHPNDAGPSQWFEILRPGNGPIRIGRVSSTCVCVGVRVPNRHVAAGERALIEARTITRPPRNNLTYGMFVSVLEPQTVMLDTDVTIRL